MPRKIAPSQSKLFSAEKETASPAVMTAYIDGGARGNPGPAGYGVLITDAEGNKVAELSQFLGHRTNNYAEYSGLLAALDYAIKKDHAALRVCSDSELLVKQMRGEYKVRSPELRVLYDQALGMIRKLQSFQIDHVRREMNREADRLANEAMDRRV